MDIPKKSWLYTGQALFGSVIGFMVGLSVSPIVNTVIGLMFAFIGGSIIVLIKGRSDDELEVTGKSITALSLLMIAGLVAGIIFRSNNVLAFGDAKPRSTDPPLTFQDIKALAKDNSYAALLCTLIKNDRRLQGNLNREQLRDLIATNVEPVVILSLLGYEVDCAGKSPQPENGGTVLFMERTPVNETGTYNPDDTPMTQ